MQCDFLKRIFDKWAERPVESVLEIACGPAYHAIQLAKMGYDSAGLDNSEKMLDYARKRAMKEDVKVDFYKRDMRKFKLPRSFDACVNVLDSIRLLLNNDDLINHLNSVSHTLNKGGLYVAEYAHPRDMLGIRRSTAETWTVESDGVKITCKYILKEWDFETQAQKFTEEYLIDDRGKTMRLSCEDKKRIILSQELLALVRLSEQLKFCNFYGAYDYEIELSNDKAWRTIVVLLRK